MVLNWLGNNWLDLLETVGVFLAALEIRNNTSARRLSNLFSITNAHRAIWVAAAERPDFERLFAQSRDVDAEPLSLTEEEQINRHILHLKVAFEAMRNGMQLSKEGVREDVFEFFQFPAVGSFWRKNQRFHDTRFVRFVESCLSPMQQ